MDSCKIDLTCSFGCARRFTTQDAYDRHIGIHNEDENLLFTIEGKTFPLTSAVAGYKCPGTGCTFVGYGGHLHDHLASCLRDGKRSRRDSSADANTQKKRIRGEGELTESETLPITNPDITNFSPLSSPSRFSFSVPDHSLWAASSQISSSPPDDLSHQSASLPIHQAAILAIITSRDENTESTILDFTGSALIPVKGSCVYHSVMNEKLNIQHNQLYGECSSDLRSAGSHFNAFRRHIIYRIRGCFFCGTPHWSSFRHAGGLKKCDDLAYEDWLRGLVYLIWRTEALRTIVFPCLGLDSNAFPTSSAYRHWLGLRAWPETTLVSNMILLIWAYMCLDDEGLLPTRRLTMDAIEPPP
ncbi:uncharacterized protein EV420DRAFT_1651144 [Desarmillaria tabescens]|uniref:C2H2-type domain-containing protein n=1 Tax=Armillaria tabescens TaxID=1929756 RepID=A0AA39MME7_ARMTA|nr:uncharacterized protein EV420DRAFT_1651144 [Desarmillaria tabescens]KAK0439084.1 hypothetical protein EV420DRAFT_1651144 [Desarmillaria tabescens]